MIPSSSFSHNIAQARAADFRHQARREDLARAVARSTQPNRSRVPGRLRFRSIFRHRAATAASSAS